MALFNFDLAGEKNQIKEMFKEILDEQIEPLIDKAIHRAGTEMDGIVNQAGKEVQKGIDKLSNEIHNQRKLTSEEIKQLIDYSAQAFGNAFDERIEKATKETATLISEKINEVREQLTDAANEQKKVAIRNATIAVSSAIIIGIISLLYKKFLHGEFDLLTIFRVILFAFACGHATWLFSKFVTSYFHENKTKRNILFVSAEYLGIFKLKGAAAHAILFITVSGIWAILNFWPEIRQLITSNLFN